MNKPLRKVKEKKNFTQTSVPKNKISITNIYVLVFVSFEVKAEQRLILRKGGKI